MTASDAELLERFPGVWIDQDNKEHWRGILDRRFLLNRCTSCGYWIYPTRSLCPSCWSSDVRAQEVSGRGRIHFLSIEHRGFPGPGGDARDYPVPYIWAAVELSERAGLRYLAPIVNVDAEAVSIDMPVKLTWIMRGDAPAPAFEPADDPEVARG
jgi:uncharacterized OB-fold protein